MSNFEHFIAKNEVRKELPNIALASSLIKDMDERLEKSMRLNIGVFSKMIFENIYDALQDFCNAILALDGYKSYSHVASIVYLSKFGFNDSEINLLDKFRLRRHGSKYYGVEISKEEAEEILDFYNKIKSKMDGVMSKKRLK